MSTQAETAPQRLDYLDGVRGWASLMVVLSHVWGQFARHNVDFYSAMPLRLISDGHFAVLVFFVLSGTALSLRFTRRPQPVALGWLMCARYVRLVLPIAITTLVVFALMKLQWYGSPEAAEAANSPILLGPRVGLTTTFVDAARFSLFDVLFHYDLSTSFNSSLWTMPVEFMGSLMVYVLLFGFSFTLALRRGRRVAIASLLTVALMAASKPEAACFGAGYVIAEMLCASPRALDAGRWAGVALLAIGAVPLATQGELGDASGAILAAGAVASIACWPLTRRLFSSRASRWLGAISFPLYLSHVIVLECGGRLFLQLERNGVPRDMATHLCAALAIPACLLAAWLLMPVERWSIHWSRAVGNCRLWSRSVATKQG